MSEHTCVATCACICPWASRDHASHLNWQDVRGVQEEISNATKGMRVTQVASGRSGHLDPELELEDGLREPVSVICTWTTQSVCGPGQKPITNQPWVCSTVASPICHQGKRQCLPHELCLLAVSPQLLFSFN